jgi:hypothetical protein
MSKSALITAAFLLAATLPAMAQSDESRRHSAMQHIGGHWRHGHRDWSETQGRGHVHNVCWEWDAVNGWEWVCR